MKYDFSGYATKNDLRCSDGRIIRKDAFVDNDGTTVPLVWQHQHDAPTNVLGHATLENRDDGVYAYCTFNNTEPANHAKVLVEHGDVNSMSIFANQLRQQGADVIHGIIREVSLVLAGANPGALIENIAIAHADGTVIENRDEAVIYSDQPLCQLVHADKTDDQKDDSSVDDSSEKEEQNEDTSNQEEPDSSVESKDDMSELEHQNGSDKTVEDVLSSLTDEQATLFATVLTAVQEDEGVEIIDFGSDQNNSVSHADTDDKNDAPDFDAQKVFDSLSDDQKTVLYGLVAAIQEQAKDKKSSDKTSSNTTNTESEETTVKHNVFDETSATDTNSASLSHDEISAIMKDAPRAGTLKEAFLQHGIEDIDVLFPEARTISDQPALVTRQMEWVAKVWNGVKKTPFSRIKTVAANLTFDEARAKGYLKYDPDDDSAEPVIRKKLEQKFPLLSRQTLPQTVYKLQKLHRDDIIDITDLDVVAWLKTEMRTMLNEELARAILVGDGRSASAEDKIHEDNIRPIYGDDDLFTIYYNVDFSELEDPTDISNALIDAANFARRDYMGSGNPVFFASPLVVTYLLLAKDKLGRRLYSTISELAAALRVSAVVEVPAFEDCTRTDSDGNEQDLLGIIVDLADYTIGADKQGAVSLFDDFDIDYNLYTYMIETRCSGALTKPYSAIALEASATSSTSFNYPVAG